MPKIINILFFIDKNSDSYASRKMIFNAYFKDFDEFNCCISSDQSDSPKLINDQNIAFIIIDALFDMSEEGINGKGLYNNIKSSGKTPLPYFFSLTTEASEAPALLGTYADFVINVVDFNPQLAHSQIKSVNRRKDTENGNEPGLITIHNNKFLFNGVELKYIYKTKSCDVSSCICPDASNQYSKLLKLYIEKGGKPIDPFKIMNIENKITNHLQYGIANIINESPWDESPENDSSKIEFEACLTISKKILMRMGEGKYKYVNEQDKAWLVAEIKEEKSKSNNQTQNLAKEAFNAEKSSSSPEKVKQKPTTNNPAS